MVGNSKVWSVVVHERLKCFCLSLKYNQAGPFSELNCQIETALETVGCLICTFWLVNPGLSFKSQQHINTDLSWGKRWCRGAASPYCRSPAWPPANGAGTHATGHWTPDHQSFTLHSPTKDCNGSHYSIMDCNCSTITEHLTSHLSRYDYSIKDCNS